nr:unnamed protein product [Callosobruchus analis]
MTYLRVGMAETEYSHVLSFRRQVFITPTENPIQDSATLTHEDTTYRIFFSLDGPVCTQCKQSNHTIEKCPNRPHNVAVIEDNTIESNTEPPITSASNNQNIQTDTLQQPAIEINTDISQESLTQQPKRQLSSPSDNNDSSTPQRDAPTKKIKSATDTKELLKPAEEYINSQYSKIELNITEIADLIDNSYKSKDIISTIKNYTKDPPTLLLFLKELYTHLKDRRTKVRITKIRRKLSKKLEIVSAENSDDDMSDSSYLTQ